MCPGWWFRNIFDMGRMPTADWPRRIFFVFLGARNTKKPPNLHRQHQICAFKREKNNFREKTNLFLLFGAHNYLESRMPVLDLAFEKTWPGWTWKERLKCQFDKYFISKHLSDFVFARKIGFASKPKENKQTQRRAKHLSNCFKIIIIVTIIILTANKFNVFFNGLN